MQHRAKHKILCFYALFLSLSIFVWGCGGDTPLPPLKGPREALVVEEKFSMENVKSKRPECSGAVPSYSCCLADHWRQYYQNSEHHLPPLGSMSSKTSLIACASKAHFQSIASDGAASSPVSWNGHIYVLRGTTLYEGVLEEGKFVLKNEHELSEDKRPLDRDGMGGIAVLPDGRAFVTLGSCEIVSICLKTKQVIWRKRLESPSDGAPTLGDGTVVCVTRRNQTVALHQKNGECSWTHQGTVEDVSLWGGGSAAISRGIVISNYSSNQVSAFSEQTGELLWTQTFAINKNNRHKIPHQKASPVFVKELVYVLTHSNIVCLVAISGQVLWQWPIGGYYTPIIVGNFVFMADQNGTLSRLDRYTGEVCWTYALPVHKEERYNSWIGPWYINHSLLLWRYDGLMTTIDLCSGKAHSVSLGHPLSASGVLLKDGMVLHTDDGGILSWKVPL